MRIAFLSIAVPGHLNPTTTLARKLQSRGHDVVLVSLLDAKPVARAAHLPFVPVCEEDYPLGSVHERLRQLSMLEGEAGLQFTLQALANSTESLFKSLPAALAVADAEGIVLDTAQLYVELVPMHLGLPFVHMSNALHFDWSGHTPIWFSDWPHETGPDALTRNREGVAAFKKFLEPATSLAKDYARKVGLPIDWNNPDTTISKLAWLTQTPKEFDFNSNHWPSQFHYTGPFHDGAGRIDVEFPWGRLTGEPLVYASMGTLQNGVERAFRAITDAAWKRQDLQFVLSIGNQLDPKQIGPAPDNTIVVKSAPQLELLKRASLCITHAGLNTTLEALAQGVPMVALPVTNDQPGVAARIADKKVGLFVASSQVTESLLSPLIDEVLDDSSYRENARRLQRAIIKTDGLSLAADLLERAFGLPTKTQPHMASYTA
jgi:MGT family glycosyltransferase